MLAKVFVYSVCVTVDDNYVLCRTKLKGTLAITSNLLPYFCQLPVYNLSFVDVPFFQFNLNSVRSLV